MTEQRERFVYFRAAKLLGFRRSLKSGRAWAQFWGLWEREIGKAFGWMEPQDSDTVQKRGTLTGLRLVMEQSDEEFFVATKKLQEEWPEDYAERKQKKHDAVAVKLIAETTCDLIGEFRLVRRKIKADVFQTFVFFSVRLTGVHGCGDLEPFLTKSKAPGKLKIFYIPEQPKPKQQNLPGAELKDEQPNLPGAINTTEAVPA